MAKKKHQIYACDACGYESPKQLGRCPNCGAWNSLQLVLEPQLATRRAERTSFSGDAPTALRMEEIVAEQEQRVLTELDELNRVLGGGVVPGSLILIGGDPGIGKSTLLLQVSAQLQQQGGRVLYVSGEESASQVKMRAERLGVRAAAFYIYPETNLEAIEQVMAQVRPDYVVIDSIQTMVSPHATGLAGSPSQVRETTALLMRLAKANNIAIFIVGHVTKEGAIAGPRMLEHMVDTVLYFEGEKHQSFRILRAVKNRFGATNEIGVFDMQHDGLKEVTNPSQLFLEERLAGATGSAVVVTMEGSRPILVEIQSLVTPTVFGNARRTASGLDHSRVSLLLAVLEKRAGLLLQNQDAYFKSAGGVKLDEPAIDLAVAVSTASSYWEQETRASDCFVGEVGLIGEIRRVTHVTERIREAQKLGFRRIFIPKNNVSSLNETFTIEVVGVATLAETLRWAFPQRPAHTV